MYNYAAERIGAVCLDSVVDVVNIETVDVMEIDGHFLMLWLVGVERLVAMVGLSLILSLYLIYFRRIRCSRLLYR